MTHPQICSLSQKPSAVAIPMAEAIAAARGHQGETQGRFQWDFTMSNGDTGEIYLCNSMYI